MEHRPINIRTARLKGTELPSEVPSIIFVLTSTLDSNSLLQVVRCRLDGGAQFNGAIVIE